MKSRYFSLVPFPGTGPLPFTISGTAVRQDHIMGLTYHLFGPITDIEIPRPADLPSRRIGLWENTCFEFFIGPNDSNRYWEFNLSPSGDWNVFRFKTYRQGLFEEKAISSLPFSVLIQPESIRLALELDLSLIIPLNEGLRLAVSVVLKAGTGDITMWALTHPGPEVDFHHNEGFIITI